MIYNLTVSLLLFIQNSDFDSQLLAKNIIPTDFFGDTK